MSGSREPHQLPSGRHGLPRAFVVSNQRERILDAVMRAVSRNGYAAMRIEDVIGLAGVSRRTFYDNFHNKEEAFLAAYDLVVDQLRGGVAAAYHESDAWTTKVRRGLAAFLNLLAAEPEVAHVCVVEAPAAGPRALQRRARAMRIFQDLLEPGTDDGGVRRDLPPMTTELVVGGIYEVIYVRAIDGRVAELPGLLPPLLYGALLPFVGHEVAAAEQRRALARAAERATGR